jgi:hypothetical protein
MTVKLDKRDFDAVEREHGPLPPTASEAARAERYRLAQAAKIMRQHYPCWQGAKHGEEAEASETPEIKDR